MLPSDIWNCWKKLACHKPIGLGTDSMKFWREKWLLLFLLDTFPEELMPAGTLRYCLALSRLQKYIIPGCLFVKENRILHAWGSSLLPILLCPPLCCVHIFLVENPIKCVAASWKRFLQKDWEPNHWTFQGVVETPLAIETNQGESPPSPPTGWFSLGCHVTLSGKHDLEGVRVHKTQTKAARTQYFMRLAASKLLQKKKKALAEPPALRNSSAHGTARLLSQPDFYVVDSGGGGSGSSGSVA